MKRAAWLVLGLTLGGCPDDGGSDLAGGVVGSDGSGGGGSGHGGVPVGPVDIPPMPAHPISESPANWPLFTGPPGLTLRADAPPPLAPPESGLRVAAARNEAESVWLGLGPGQGSVTASVEGLGDLRVTLYGVGFTRGFADALTPLRPGEAWPLDARGNSGLLIDVYVPEGVRAGEREATLVLERPGVPPLRLPLAVHVFDFDLPREIHFKSQLNLSMEALVAAAGSVEAARDLLFGLRLTPANPTWPSGFRWDVTWDSPENPRRCQAFYDEADESPEFSIGALARRLLTGADWNGAGFPDAQLFQFVDNSTPRPDTFCGERRGDAFGTDGYNAAWSAWLAALRGYLEANGLLGRTYAYLQNEPQDADDARLAAHLCRLTRAAAPGLRIAISEQPTPAIAEDPDGPCGYDLWIAALQHYQPAYALERQRDHGEEVWLYSLDHDPEPYFNPTSAERDVLHARVIPWVSWRLRTRGWAYYDGGRFFPGGLPNLRALALRDGFEDYEYLYLANGGAHPQPGAPGALDRTVAGVVSSLTDWRRDPAAFQALRLGLGAYLGGERETLPVLEAPPPGGPPGMPPGPRFINFQDPMGEPRADPLVVLGHTWEKAGWAPWDERRALGFVGEHVGDPAVALAGYDDVPGVPETQRSYLYDDFGRPALFELGVAPGRYRVRVGLGRPARPYPNDPMNLTLEGEPVVVDHVGTDAAPTLVSEVEVEVFDGRLSVGFGGRSALTGEFAYTFFAFVSAEPLAPAGP